MTHPPHPPTPPTPRTVYNILDDLAADGVDAMEGELRRALVDEARRKRRGAPGEAPQPLDAATEAALTSSCDALVTLLHNAHVGPGDKWEEYAIRTAFAIPRSLAEAVEAACPPPGLEGGGRRYSPSEEAAADARIANLEAQLLAERRRRRALGHVAALLEKRMPAAEEAATALEGVAKAFATHGGAWAG